MAPKKQAVIGLFLATFVALPLFVFSVTNINFNLNENAQFEPKGGNENYDYLINATPLSIPIATAIPPTTFIPQSAPLENQFINKYAMYIFAGFVVFIISAILIAVNSHKRRNIY